MKRKPSWQDRNRSRTTRANTRANDRSLFIEGLTYAERDHLRARVFYSGAGDDYIASSALFLPLAIAELTKLRRRSVRVTVDRDGFHLSSSRRALR